MAIWDGLTWIGIIAALAVIALVIGLCRSQGCRLR